MTTCFILGVGLLPETGTKTQSKTGSSPAFHSALDRPAGESSHSHREDDLERRPPPPNQIQGHFCRCTGFELLRFTIGR